MRAWLAIVVGLALASLTGADELPTADPADLDKGKLLVAARQLADPNFAHHQCIRQRV